VNQTGGTHHEAHHETHAPPFSATHAQGHAEAHLGQAQRRRRRGFGRLTVRTKLADLGQEIFPRDRQTPEALAAFQKADIDKWWPIIEAGNIKTE
jgi:hypothetical protein